MKKILLALLFISSNLLVAQIPCESGTAVGAAKIRTLTHVGGDGGGSGDPDD